MLPTYGKLYAAESLAFPGEVRTFRWLWFPTLAHKMALMRMVIDHYAQDPRVHEYAFSVIDKACVRPRDSEGQVRAILDHVRDFRYLNETVETFQTPVYTLRHQYGDCDDFTMCAASLLESCDIPTRLEVMAWGRPREDGTPNWRHVYLRAGLPPRNPTRWVPCETTMQLPWGTEPRDYIAKRMASGKEGGL